MLVRLVAIATASTLASLVFPLLVAPTIAYLGVVIVLAALDWAASRRGDQWALSPQGIIGLHVVCRNGLPINARSSAVRNLMRIVDILPASYVVGLISIIVSASCERLGDHAAGTLVVRLDRPEAASELPVGADMNQVALTRQQLARIGPRELQLVRGTLRRVANLPGDRGAQLVAEVAETLRTRMELDALLPRTASLFCAAY